MYQLFSHNDLDGVGCGIVAKIAFDESVQVRYNSVGGLDFQVKRFLEKEENKNQTLFITDLSVNEENEKNIDEFIKSGGKIQLIDHHKTALHFNNYHWGQVQVAYQDGRLASATSLLYDYLKNHNLLKPNKALDQFVELVRQYDTWEWDKNNNIDAKRLNDLFFLVSIDEFEERMVERLTESEEFSFDDFEKKLLDMEENKIERYIRRKRRELIQTDINDFCVGVVHAESYHSELGNALGKDNSHLDYIAILNVGGRKMSYRTIHDDVDVSEIAGLFGGGGHAKASGSPMSEDAYNLFVAKLFKLDPLKIDADRNRYNLKAAANGSLFEDREENEFFIFEKDSKWFIEQNGESSNEGFESFEEAERFIKRLYGAALVRDDRYVKFLLNFYNESKKLNKSTK